MNALTALFFILVVILAEAVSVNAHTRSQSFSSWYIQDGQVRLGFSVQALEATRLELLGSETFDLDELLVQHLAPRIVVRTESGVCRTVAGPQTRAALEGYLRVEWRFTCPTDSPIEVVNDAFFDVAPSHVHYARVRGGNTRTVEVLFTNTERRRVIAAGGQANPGSRGASFVSYLWLGVEHILIGIDHLAFLCALLLLCRRARDVAVMVTGFTVGHSLTLSLAALGIITPNVPVIEALIGFTIALVAAENVSVTTGSHVKIAFATGGALMTAALLKVIAHVGLPALTLAGLALSAFCYLLLIDTRERAGQWRPVLAVLFGLIHGFGFASVLLEIGLPTDRLVAALFGFNFGVEIGQLGIVAALWVAGVWVTRRFPTANYRLGVDTASAALCALGLFWFVERSL